MRDQAIVTLVEIYRHVGERARTDLIKKAGGAGIADARLRTITARFDAVRDAGQMIADLDPGQYRPWQRPPVNYAHLEKARGPRGKPWGLLSSGFYRLFLVHRRTSHTRYGSHALDFTPGTCHNMISPVLMKSTVGVHQMRLLRHSW